MTLDDPHAPVVTAVRHQPTGDSNAVRIVDVDIPFGSLVVLIIKWALAAVPALIVLAIIGAIVTGLLAAVMATIGLA